MTKHKNSRIFAAFMALVMVLTMLTPINVFANTDTKAFKQNLQDESLLELKKAIAEQLEVSDSGPKLHQDLQGLADDTQVSVIVHLSEKPVALEQGIKELSGQKFTAAEASQAKASVNAQQASVFKEMKSNAIAFKQGYTYNTVLNGFAATMKAGDLQKLLTIKGVTLVEPDVTVYASEVNSSAFKTSGEAPDGEVEAMMNTSISFLGIEKLWNEGIQGQGVKVAVLDTGIDADHPEFEGVYKGGKNFVTHNSNYTRQRADNDASETLPSERAAGVPEFNSNGSSFYTSHGTHVAGTIAAQGKNPYGIKGIAPKVELYAYRVLGAYGSGSNSGIIKAIETAVTEKMNVINLSLGGGSNTETDAGSFAINNAMMAGVISVLATGNSGPNRGTMGTPATARLGIAVGNTTNPEKLYKGKIDITAGSYTYSKEASLMGTTFGVDLANQLQGEFDIVAIPGFGEAKDYTGIDVKGKIVLVSRGSIAFVDKIAHAKANGAVGTIIHNNTGGTAPANLTLGDAFEFIPTFDISQNDGAAIRAAITNGGKVKFSSFTSTTTTGDQVNDSSSRGPSTPNFDIKPDVTAPGTNIMSSVPMYKADFPDAKYDTAYERFTGTSMATPHIAGIAALVKQANPSWNAFDVKVALSNTAKILDKKYDVFAQGAGRVDAYAAARPSALAYAIDKAVLDGTGTQVDNKKGTVTFGAVNVKDQALSTTKDILVKDISKKGGAYTVSVEVTKAFGDAKVTVDKPSFTLNGEQALKVTLSASKNANAKSTDEILGYIHIKGGSTEISLPFAANFGGTSVAATEFKNFTTTETDLSFNGDGYKDSTRLSFELTGNVTTHYLEIWDIMNPEGGAYGDGYIGYMLAGNSLAAGKYNLDVLGTYRNWSNTGVAAKIPDGLYTFDFSALTVSGNPAVVGGYVGPIVVKTTKPEISGALKDGNVAGVVVDKYIEYNEELYWYELEYDINTKLAASYVITKDGAAGSEVPFLLNQNGTYSFDTGSLEPGDYKITVYVKDAAGNKGEKVVYEGKVEGPAPTPTVSLEVNKTAVSLAPGATEQLTVKEVTTPKDGTPSETDVTTEAVYTVADEAVVTVNEGLITAKAVGTTSITITYNGHTATVGVTVTEDPAEDVVTLKVNKTSVNLQAGKTEQLTVTEVTTPANGEATEVDVTSAATYTVADEKVATVSAGLISAIAEGTTTATIEYNGLSTSLNITITDEDTEPNPPSGTLKVDRDKIELTTLSTTRLKVTEEIVTGDEVESIDVTDKATYTVADEKVVTAKGGNIVPKGVGKTVVTISYGDQEVYVEVTVIKPPVDDSRPKDPKPETPKPETPKPETPVLVFSDIKGHWSEQYVQKIAQMGMIKGYPDGTFKPNAELTRTQAVSLIVRALGLKTDEAAPFADIRYYAKETQAEIAAAYKYGIIKGDGNKFNPQDKVTRAQLALMIHRAYSFVNGKPYEATTIAPFNDLGNYNSETIKAISMLYELKIVDGDNGKFNPSQPTTRAHAAKMLVNFLSK